MKGKEIRRWLPTSVLWAGFLLSPAKVISVAQIFFFNFKKANGGKIIAYLQCDERQGVH